MQYKLICVDMDGTLLNSKHMVSDVTREAIKKAHDKGADIVITTGRTYIDAKYFSDLIGVSSPVVASNGAYIMDKKDGVIFKSAIDKDLCLRLLDIFIRHGVHPIFYTPDDFYLGSLQIKLFFEYAKLKGLVCKDVRLVRIKKPAKWRAVIEKESGSIVKCEVVVNNEAKLVKLRRELERIAEIELSTSIGNNIEITGKGVSKGHAVEILADKKGIRRDEIICIGDSENDISMIKFAGMGVAMANAADDVKKRARYITDSNDNDGVAKVIERFILSDVDVKY